MKKNKLSFNNIEEIITAIAMLVTILAIVVNICSGIITEKRYGQLEEISTTAFVWVTFLGIGVAYKHSAHICIDFIVELFPKKVKDIIEILVLLTLMVFSVYVVYVSSILAIEATNKTTALLDISYFFIDLSVILGFISLFIRSSIDFVKTLKLFVNNNKKLKSFKEVE